MRRTRRALPLALATLVLVLGCCLVLFGVFVAGPRRSAASLSAAQRAVVARWVDGLPMALAVCLYDVHYLATTPAPTPGGMPAPTPRAGSGQRVQSPWLIAATSAPVDCSQARLALARYAAPGWLAALPDVRTIRQDFAPLTQPFLTLNDLRDSASAAYRREAARLAAAMRLAAPVHAALARLNVAYHATYPLPY
jgi:hypothetical protein